MSSGAFSLQDVDQAPSQVSGRFSMSDVDQAAKPSFMEKLADAAKETHYGMGDFADPNHPAHAMLSEGYQDIKSGNYQQGAHKLISGALEFLKPAAPAIIASAPMAAAASAGTGYIGSKLGEQYGPQVGLTPELGSDIGGLVGASLAPGAKAVGASDAVANMARDEAGKLRPGVKVASRAAGAAIGHATGIPGAEIAGVFGGPSLADALIPSREATVGKAVPIRTSPYFNPEEYRAGQKGLPAGNATPFKQPQEIVKQSTAEAPAKFSEGRPATWTNDLVKELAAWGDPDAIEQARLRGFGRVPLKYSEVEVSPREVVHFDAAGNPQ